MVSFDRAWFEQQVKLQQPPRQPPTETYYRRASSVMERVRGELWLKGCCADTEGRRAQALDSATGTSVTHTGVAFPAGEGARQKSVGGLSDTTSTRD